MTSAAARIEPNDRQRIPDLGHQYPDEADLETLARWIDSLDRI